MFRHLLVPLDGSALAEIAVRAAASIAEKEHARVTLLHVVEKGAPQEIHGQRHLTGEHEALAYLEEIKARLPAGISVEMHVHSQKIADVAHSLYEHAGEMEASLVVMCRHGRSGLRGMLFGSIAQQVVALGETPVLLLSPEAPEWQARRILVPLDGEADHETGVICADALARAFGAQLELLVVVPTRSTLPGTHALASGFLPGTTRMLLEMSEQSAREYLAGVSAKLPPRKLPVLQTVLRGEPAKTIAEFARSSQADIVCMGTHGTAGTQAFWAQSVTARVAARTRAALLLAPSCGKKT